MKKIFLSIMLVAVMIFSLVSCAKKQTEEEIETQIENFDVVLDWYPNAVHAFIYDAIEKGYYAEEGLNINIVTPSNPNDAISLTAAGKADIGIYYLQDVIMARANEDIPIKAVGTIVQKPLSIFLSLKENNITKPEDLEGKTIGYGSTELSEAIIKTVIENAGKDADSVTTIDVGFDLISAMVTKNVDATIGCLINHEVPEMEKTGLEVNYFFPSDYGVPNYYELVFVTGEKQAEEDKEKIAKFLRASKKGFDDMKSNPEEVLKILLNYQEVSKFSLDENVERKSLEYLIPRMETEDAEFLTQEKDVWQENSDWLFENNLLKEKFDVSEVLQNIL